MKESRKSQRKINQKLNLTRLMRGLILLLSLIGLGSIIHLISVYSSITDRYYQITNEIYLDVEYMSDLNESMYQHQNLVFEHIIASYEVKKKAIESEADSLAQNMRQLLTKFGETTTGSKYEIYYHNIYSGIIGYLKNVDIIFDFSRNNEVETAQYYMENVLEDYLDDVNDVMKTLDDITKQDTQSAKEQMNKDIEAVGLGSSIILVVLVAFSVVSQIVGYRISDMMVNVDAATGIINNSSFLEKLEKRQKKGTLAGYTVFAINIKGFQYINQTVGAENGEQVLRKYAQLLKEKMGKNELAAKSAGDGFVVLMRNERTEEFLAFLNSITLDITLDSKEELESVRKIRIGVPSRCGYYAIENDVPSSKALENATLALKTARSTSESDQIRYEENMFVQAINQNQMIHEFRSAVENKEFIVYYQPKVCLEDDKLCGAEALVRWLRDDRIIPPREFIYALEREGYITDLDFYVFETVCTVIMQWLKDGYDVVPVSVNFSCINLKDERFAERILDIMNIYRIDSRYFEIELTGTIDDKDFEKFAAFTKKIKKAGFKVSIDFGTGNSTLSMLKEMDVDSVKLDNSLIRSIVDDKENSEDEKMVRNIIHILNDLHKEVICVGAETLKQAELLKNAGCGKVQGFLYDRPLPSEEFADRLVHSNY